MQLDQICTLVIYELYIHGYPICGIIEAILLILLDAMLMLGFQFLKQFLLVEEFDIHLDLRYKICLIPGFI